MNWQKITFESLYEAPSRNGIYKSKEFHGSGVRIVNMGEMFEFPFIGSQTMKSLRVTDDEFEKFGLQSGDLLFARRSLVEEGAGKCALIVDHKEPMVFESSMIRVRLKRERCDPKFYYYYFKSPSGRSNITAIVTGVAQKGIRGSDLAKIEVDNPPLEAQKDIAKILTKYDNLIDNNNRRIALLEESVHLLYREWFVHLRFPGCDQVKVVDGVPEGWEKKKLGDICSEIRQSIHPSETEPQTPYVGLEHIPRRSIALTEWGASEEVSSNKFRFERHDILFGKIRPYFHKVVFAPVSGICSSDTIIIRPDSEDVYGLVLALASSVAFVDFSYKTAKEGSKMPRANWKVMQQYPLLLPPSAIRREFNDFVSSSVQQIEIFIFANQKMKEARDRLLPRLMNGSITV